MPADRAPTPLHLGFRAPYREAWLPGVTYCKHTDVSLVCRTRASGGLHCSSGEATLPPACLFYTWPKYLSLTLLTRALLPYCPTALLPC